ncbi:MAG: hypothetical protein ACLQVD_10805 [Capsulimonadaceae bacterium]
MVAGELALCIPIVAIVMVFGTRMVAEIIQSQERRLKIKLQNEQASSQTASVEIAQLRAEFAQLREITVQHSLSLDNALQSLNRRVARLEQGAGTTEAAAPGPPGTEPALDARLSGLEVRTGDSGIGRPKDPAVLGTMTRS